MASTIYIIYNANGTFGGKLSYAYRKLTSPEPACAACDLTHGGLRLTETAQWTATKKQIGANVQQLHRDELPQNIIDFASANDIKYPAVLGKSADGELQLLLTGTDLVGIKGNHEEFLKVLKEKAMEKGVVLNDAATAAVL
jgi:hypothetical protein